jgi:hypothetical protein
VGIFATNFAHEAAGASCTRHPARPLYFGGGDFSKTSGASRREIANVYLIVIARSEATKQSILSLFPPY